MSECDQPFDRHARMDHFKKLPDELLSRILAEVPSPVGVIDIQHHSNDELIEKIPTLLAAIFANNVKLRGQLLCTSLVCRRFNKLNGDAFFNNCRARLRFLINRRFPPAMHSTSAPGCVILLNNVKHLTFICSTYLTNTTASVRITGSLSSSRRRRSCATRKPRQ